MKVINLKITFSILIIIFLTGCLTKQKISNLAEAENQIITTEGRHFFTSSSGIAELTYEYGERKLEYIKTDCDALNGIESIGQWLIAVCADSKLIKPKHKLIKIDLSNTDPTTHSPHVSTLFELTDIALPNGLAISPNQDSILIANYNLFGRGFISRLQLNISDDSLTAGNFDLKFLNHNHGIASANGIRFSQGELYVSDFNIAQLSSRIIKISFIGDEYLSHQTIFSAPTILDDLLPTCKGILVTDYLMGRLIFIDKDGQISRSSVQQFPGITSVVWGQYPLFPDKTLVITERGILNDSKTLIGNQISSSRITDRLLRNVGAKCSNF
jgi:hypothetical protein